MATKLYFRSTVSEYSTGAADGSIDFSVGYATSKAVSTSAGASTTLISRATSAGPHSGISMIEGAQNIVWYSPPLDADITISGSVTWNIWGRESDMAANVAINGQLAVVDGATGTITLIDKTARTTEMAISATTNSVSNFSETPGAGVACKRGDRLRVQIFGDDVGTMASGYTFAVGYDGPTASVDGDTWVQLTENLTFVSEPAGTTIYPTDTASAVSTASVDREAWTSRGAGVQTDVVNTAAGFSPIQITDTAAGTVVDWFTRPLTAFTLGGAVRVNVRGLESNAAANAGLRVEIARVAGDGTSATVWGRAAHHTELTTSEAAYSFLVGGDDLAISDGQRLRVRMSLVPAGATAQTAGLVTGHTATLYYAGTSGGASGDTYLTFTQTLTEYNPNITVTPTTAALVVASAGAPTVISGTYAAAVMALSPIAYWRLGEPSGTSAFDIAGSNNTGTYVGGPTLGAASALATDTANTAVTLNGTDEWVTVPDHSSLDQGNGPLSWTVWLKRSNTASGFYYFMSKGTQSPSLYMDGATGVVQFFSYAEGAGASSTVSITDTTTWHFIVGTKSSGNAWKIYIDGADVTSVLASSITSSTTDPLLIGNDIINGDELPASLDEIALFNSVLSLGQIQALYAAATATGTTATPTTLALTLATFAPTIVLPQTVTPTTLALTLTTFAPVIKLVVTPTTVALTVTTFAPTVTATANQSVTPTTLALTLTTFAPTVSTPQLVTPTTVALTLTTFAPTVTASDHQTVTPTTVALTLATFAATVTATELQLVTPSTASFVLATFAPTVTASDHKTATPTTATLTLAAFAPVLKLSVIPTTVALTTAAFAPTVTASNHQSVTPSTAALTLTTFAATVSLSNNQSVTPTTATLTLATFAPVLKLVVTPSTTSLALTTFAPTVSATAHVVATPTTLALTLTTFAATVTATAHQTVTPTTAALTLTTQAPSVTTGGNVEFVPNPVALTLATFAPTVTGAQNVTVTPTTAALTLTTFAATVTATAHQTVTPTTKALTLAFFTPAVTATDSKVAIPTTAALVTTKFAPTVTASNHQTATPTTKALALATFAPTVSATAHQVATPTTLALTLTRFAPTVTASNVTGVTPSTASLTLTTFAPTVTAIANIVVTPTTATLTLTAYAPQLRQTVTVPSASLTLATFAPTANVSDNTYVVPGTLPLILTGYDPDVVGIGPVSIVPSTAGLVLVGYAPLVFEAGPIDFIDGELVVADPVRGVLVVTSPHHGASVGANGRGRTTLVVTTPYIKGDVESN